MTTLINGKCVEKIEDELKKLGHPFMLWYILQMPKENLAAFVYSYSLWLESNPSLQKEFFGERTFIGEGNENYNHFMEYCDQAKAILNNPKL